MRRINLRAERESKKDTAWMCSWTDLCLIRFWRHFPLISLTLMRVFHTCRLRASTWLSTSGIEDRQGTIHCLLSNFACLIIYNSVSPIRRLRLAYHQIFSVQQNEWVDKHCADPTVTRGVPITGENKLFSRCIEMLVYTWSCQIVWYDIHVV